MPVTAIQQALIRRKIERAGGIFRDIQKMPDKFREDHILYVDPATGTSLMSPLSASVKSIKAKISRRRKRFKEKA